jgi:ABC-type bacteriocin/lantibiotic exporter with double-glycine peptidase domain
MGMNQQPERAFRKRLLDELALRYRALSGILLASLVLNICGLAAPRLTQTVLQRVIPSGDFSLLGVIMIGFVTICAIQTGLIILRRLALVRLSLSVDESLAGQIMARLLTLPIVGRRPCPSGTGANVDLALVGWRGLKGCGVSMVLRR